MSSESKDKVDLRKLANEVYTNVNRAEKMKKLAFGMIGLQVLNLILIQFTENEGLLKAELGATIVIGVIAISASIANVIYEKRLKKLIGSLNQGIETSDRGMMNG